MTHSQRRHNFLRDTANLSEAPSDKENVGPPGKLTGPGGLRKAVLGRRVLGHVENKLTITPQQEGTQGFQSKDTTTTTSFKSFANPDRACTPGNTTGPEKGGLVTPGPTPAPVTQVCLKSVNAKLIHWPTRR